MKKTIFIFCDGQKDTIETFKDCAKNLEAIKIYKSRNSIETVDNLYIVKNIYMKDTMGLFFDEYVISDYAWDNDSQKLNELKHTYNIKDKTSLKQ